MTVPSLSRRFASRLYHIRREHWRPWPADFDSLLDRVFASAGPDDWLVQIGANNGISGDPLHDLITSREIPSVRVEPVPSLFEELVANNAGLDHVRCVNCAIAAHNGAMPFYVVRGVGERYPPYFSQIGSFDRSVIEKQHRDFPGIDEDIEEILVKCKTFDNLLFEAGFEKATIVHTDVEGYDLDILEPLDFDRLKTRVIIFEHVHVDRGRYREFLARLRKLGYTLRDGGTDTVAYR